jgi:ribosomal protein L11
MSNQTKRAGSADFRSALQASMDGSIMVGEMKDPAAKALAREAAELGYGGSWTAAHDAQMKVAMDKLREIAADKMFAMSP